MDGIAATVDLITRGGVITLLVMALVGGMRGWYVWGTTHDKELLEKDKVIEDKERTIVKTEKDRDYWRDVAVRTLSVGEKAIKLKIDDAS